MIAVDIYFPDDIRPAADGGHLWNLITARGEEIYNLDDLDYVLVFRKLR
jgi:hypothetical protein